MTRPRPSNRGGWIVAGRLALAVVLACGALQASRVSAQVSDPPESARAALGQPPPEHTLAPNPPYVPTRRWDTLPPYPGNTRPSVERPLPAPTKPAGIDLDATYISRTPAYLRYDVLYRDGVYPFLAPGSEQEKRWPDPGEIVTFTAHFANKGTVPSGPFSYAWLIDDVLAGTGSHNSLAPGAVGTVDFQWPWAHTLEGERLGGSHTVRFVLDPGNAIGEIYESNNVLEDATGAVSLMLAVTPQLYQALETPVAAQWPFSAEDWLQKQIAAMNLAFANSAYPSAPNGIVERVRLDRIVVVDMPPPNDLGLDGGFFMSVDDRFGNAYYHQETDVSGALIHELSHQLGLPDLYGLDVVLEIPQVLDRNGQPVQTEFTLSYRGLMSDPGIVPPIYDEYSALALNINRGYRRGYYAEFFFDVPEATAIRVLDNQGNPAPNAMVKIYQRTFRPFMMGSLHGVIDNTPEITVTTDASGKATLPNRPVGTPVTTHTGHTLTDNPLGVIDIRGNNLNLLVEVSQGAHQEFTWLDITQLNLAAFRNESTLTVQSHIPPSGAPLPPGLLTGRLEQQQVYLRWQPSPSGSIRGYNIYRATAPRYEYVRIADNVTAFVYTDPGPGHFSSRAASYAITAVDSSGRESGFGNLFWALRVMNPASVVADGQRVVVMDPQPEYSLFVRSPSGQLIDTLGSFDLHLEYSQFIGGDSSGNLLISHPGDYYTARHSVRVADANATQFLEFGSRGAGNGQFDNPGGVAAWGSPCVVGGPYNPDSHTRLLVHFDGTLLATDGTPGNGTDTPFVAGRFDRGVLISQPALLTYPTLGRFPATEGSLEFWFSPLWSGQDGGWPMFFQISSGSATEQDDLYLIGAYSSDLANPGNYLLALMQNDGAVWPAWGWSPTWQAGQWYHIAMTWKQGDKLQVYLNGRKIGESAASLQPPNSLAERMFIGMTSGGGNHVRGVIDELRISDIVRLGNSDTCSYRFLVADQGNHRVQAFDWTGNFKTAFGTFGSGAMQFNTPQGVAVDAAGRVLVADSGNNRIQVLSFDGAHFGYISTLAAGLNRPTGLAAYGDRWVAVANTSNDEIAVLDTTAGQVVAQYTAPNDGYAGNFNRPRGVAVDVSGNLVVADTGNARVVSVLGALPSSTPSPTPSPTATPTRTSTPMPTPTRTSTPTVTATAAWLSTPTPTATSTPTRRAQRVYLPLMTKDR